MEFHQFVELITLSEEKFPVDEWKVENIHVWPLIRFFFIDERYGKKSSVRSVQKSRFFSLVQGIMNILRLNLKDSQHNEKIRGKSYRAVFLARSTMRNFKIYDHYYSPIIDTFKGLLDSLNHDVLLLEFDPLRKFKIPRYSSTKIIQIPIDIARMKARIHLLFHKNKIDVNLPSYDKFLEFLKSKGFSSPYLDRNTLIYQTLAIRKIANYYKKILGIVKPLICFTVPYYIPECFAMNLASAELDIPSVDVQHGLQDSHLAYKYWKKFPDEGYKLFPNYFWVWSNDEKDQIENWKNMRENTPKPFIGGNLWVNLWKSESNSFTSTYERNIDLTKFHNHPNILISLQPLVDPSIIFDAIQISDPNYYWWIRLHPQMAGQYQIYHDKMQQMGITNYNLEEASEIALPFLLKNVDVHITGFSTVILEAAQFNVKSICVEKEAKQRYRNQISRGILLEAYTKEEIVNAIKKIVIEASEEKTTHTASEQDSNSTLEKFLTLIQNETKKS